MRFNRRSPWVILPAFLVYLIVGTLQVVAVAEGLQTLLDWPGALAWFAGYLVGYVPVVGSFAGALGAFYGWHWSAHLTATIFLVPAVGLGLLLWPWGGSTRSR